jgi:hypothetical protein
MPELSRFYGLVIRMFIETGERHHRPHFHAVSADGEAVFAIDDLAILAGMLPPRDRRLVEAWAELHRIELLDNWARLQAGGIVAPIEPLH